MRPLPIVAVAAFVALVAVACSSGAAPTPEQATARLLVDGREWAFTDARVLSVDDANERFQVTMWSAAPPPENAGTVTLDLGEQVLESSTWGGDGTAAWFVFPVTEGTARVAAAALGVGATKRAPWSVLLSGRIEPVAPLVAHDERLPLRFVLTNEGPGAIWFLDGGRSRNALGRDNRFTVTVERDGIPLAIRRVEDFGGMGSYRRLAAGESWPFAVDLAHWCGLDRPGQCELRVTYEAELMPPEFEPGAQLPLGWHSHLQRVRQIVAETKLDVH